MSTFIKETTKGNITSAEKRNWKEGDIAVDCADKTAIIMYCGKKWIKVGQIDSGSDDQALQRDIKFTAELVRRYYDYKEVVLESDGTALGNFKEFIFLSKQNKEILNKVAEIERKISDQVIPYKKGDIVNACSFSHKGKRCVITDCLLWIEDSRIRIIVSADVLKKDGTLSIYSCQWEDYNDQKLTDAIALYTGEIDSEYFASLP